LVKQLRGTVALSNQDGAAFEIILGPMAENKRI